MFKQHALMLRYDTLLRRIICRLLIPTNTQGVGSNLYRREVLMYVFPTASRVVLGIMPRGNCRHLTNPTTHDIRGCI